MDQLNNTSQPTFSISTKDLEPLVDIGTTATIDKNNKNTSPLPLPNQFGQVMHMDILFGSRTAIAGIKYALFIVDRATRQKFILPLTNLKNDILDQLKQFCQELGFVPKRFLSDCDNKLFSLTNSK